MMRAFLHGLILAFGLIFPLGVQNVFILTQGAIQRRWRRALPAVLTASLCDTLLILLAVLDENREKKGKGHVNRA
ncbi:lysine transporter [Geobacillus stearothermophilus 10]|nr:lysine transporter [Geobacillus stearothermophilus 10]